MARMFGSSTIPSPASSTPRPSAGISNSRSPGTTCLGAGAPAGPGMPRWLLCSRRSSTTSARRTSETRDPASVGRARGGRGPRDAGEPRRPGSHLRHQRAGRSGGGRSDVHGNGMSRLRLHPRGRAREAAARNRRPRGAGERGLGSAVDDRPHDAGRPRRARGLGPRRMTPGYKRVSGDAVEYEVFARKSRVEALHLVGSVVAPDDDLAMAYARATYDEERWCEMAIVRKEHVIELWQPGEA